MITMRLSIYDSHNHIDSGSIGLYIVRWFQEYEFHRFDGPASTWMYASGRKECWWYIDGCNINYKL